MTDSKQETLAEYVTRVMAEKDLSGREVEARSGDEIADAYVMKIANGGTTNPSIEKTKALAKGLGVDEDELFLVARGIPLKGKRPTTGDPWPSNILIKGMDKIVSSPDLTKAVQLLLKIPPAKVKAFLKILEKEAE
jgi:transcriptional regulator with XRE-family HTH domain